jgi:hypothetical protein
MLNRKIITVAAIASSLAVTATPALGKGGGKSVPDPQPAPAPWSLCPEFAAGGPSILPDGSSLGANEIPGVLCVVDRATPTGSLLLYTWRVGPGWVADVRSSGGGNSNKIDVQVTNQAGEKHEITVQPGKTVIR